MQSNLQLLAPAEEAYLFHIFRSQFVEGRRRGGAMGKVTQSGKLPPRGPHAQVLEKEVNHMLL